MVWYPGGPERIGGRTTAPIPDILHTTPTELRLPTELHAFMTAARKATFASEEPPIQVPGRLGYNRYEYHQNESNIFYEDEYYDNPEHPWVFSGDEAVKTLGRRGQILVAYKYTGELTEVGMEMGEDVVYPKLQYFLREHADRARFGQTFEVEHRDRGKWTYTNIGNIGRKIWMDKEFLRFGGNTVLTLFGAGSIFLP